MLAKALGADPFEARIFAAGEAHDVLIDAVGGHGTKGLVGIAVVEAASVGAKLGGLDDPAALGAAIIFDPLARADYAVIDPLALARVVDEDSVAVAADAGAVGIEGVPVAARAAAADVPPVGRARHGL
jgi:hypothetical protein